MFEYSLFQLYSYMQITKPQTVLYQFDSKVTINRNRKHNRKSGFLTVSALVNDECVCGSKMIS